VPEVIDLSAPLEVGGNLPGDVSAESADSGLPPMKSRFPYSAFSVLHWLNFVLLALCMPPLAVRAAEGLLGAGVGARSMGMGGTEVATPGSALGALASNPAGLSLLTGLEVDGGFEGASAYGHFESKDGGTGVISQGLDIAPEGAIAVPVPKTPLALGVGVIPEMALAAHWNYPDPLGGLGGLASYGQQRDNSEIEELRIAIGMSVAITRQLSIGGALGLNYNENLLQTPYIFQSQPVLRGFKTLLNLSTSGWGANGTAGLLYKPADTVSLALSYQSQTIIKTHGDASGNADAQLNALGPGFAGVGRDFHYDAEVDNTFPQLVSGGVAWKFLPKWEASVEVDWTGWSDAFDTLPVKLTNGSNAQINGLVGSRSLQDNIPLRWKDEFTYRIGVEREITSNILLRCGYAYSKSPVPGETLTPLTAALPEQTLSVGAGYHWRWLEVDVAYQWDLPVTRHIGTSSLADGEYSNSDTQVGAQWLGVTTEVRF
jgi:long-chain fatty acid transport protein